MIGTIITRLGLGYVRAASQSGKQLGRSWKGGGITAFGNTALMRMGRGYDRRDGEVRSVALRLRLGLGLGLGLRLRSGIVNIDLDTRALQW